MNVRKNWILWLIIIVCVWFIVLISCNKKASTGPEDGDEHAAWFPPSINLEYQYRIYDTPTESWDGTAKVLGTDSQTYPGNTYVMVQIGNFTGAAPRGVILWLDLSTIDKIGFKAAKIYWGNAAQGKSSKKINSAVGDWNLLEVYNTPLWVEYNGKLGETKTSTTDAMQYYNGDMNDKMALTMSVEYTYTSLSATVEVPYGTVGNCILMDAVYTETTSFGTFAFTGKYYMRPDLGVVKATTIPGFASAELISGNILKALFSLAF